MTAPQQPESARTAEVLLRELRSEITRADSKASVLVAALGTMAGLCSGLLAGRSWHPSSLTGAGTTLWWAGVICLACSLHALLMAVLPRYRMSLWRPGRPLAYFGDIQKAARAGLLAQALDDTHRSPQEGLLAALDDTSRIASRKHQWIRVGLLAFGLGAALLPSALLFG